MGHESTARMLSNAGAVAYPPRGLFRNIWDPDELIKLVQTSINCINTLEGTRKLVLSLLYLQSAEQFHHMGQSSSAEEMGRRALEEKPLLQRL